MVKVTPLLSLCSISCHHITSPPQNNPLIISAPSISSSRLSFQTPQELIHTFSPWTSLSSQSKSAICKNLLFGFLVAERSRSRSTTPRSERKSKQTRRVCAHDSEHHFFPLALFTFLYLYLAPAANFLFPILSFNCHDRQTYGQWAVARKRYIFVTWCSYSTAALPHERKQRKINI